MCKQIRILIIALILVSQLFIAIPTSASDITVNFERIKESPVDVTFRVTISGLTGDYPADIKFQHLSSEIKITEIVNVVQTQYIEQVPVYGLRDTTVKDLLDYSSSYPLPKAVTDYLKTLLPSTKLKDIISDISKIEGGLEALNSLGLTINDLLYYKAVTKTITDRTPIALFAGAEPKQFTVSLNSTRVYEITLRTGISVNPDTQGWGSKGVLVVNINGVDYYDMYHSSWWNNSWLYRRQLAFNNVASTENLTEFPVLVTNNSSNIDYSHTQNAGQDIRFVDADGATSLSYEVERWDETGNSYTWVNVPQIDAGSATDFIYEYYGNDTVADGQDVAGTWNANYVLVSHMVDMPDTSHVLDSTIYGNNGTKTGAGNPAEANAQIYKGQDYPGVDSVLNCGSATILDNIGRTGTYEFTIECWFNPATAGESGAGRLFDKGKFSAWIGANLYFQVYVGGLAKQVNSAGGITLGSWHYGVCLFNGTNLQCCLGNTWYTGAVGGQADDHSANSFLCGDNAASDRCFDGLIDEMRISNIARSVSWTRATYLTETNAFITFSSEATFYLLPPTSIILIDLGSSTVSVNWTIVANPYADGTIVRVRRDNYPIDPTDGDLVYMGSALAANATGLNLDAGTYYFSAWCYNNGGAVIYSTDYITGQIGGTVMMYFGLIGLVCIISGFTLWKPNLILAIMSSGMWGVLLWYLVNNPISGMESSTAGGNMIVLVCMVGIIALPVITMARLGGEKRERITRLKKEGEERGIIYDEQGKPKRQSDYTPDDYQKRLDGIYRARGKR